MVHNTMLAMNQISICYTLGHNDVISSSIVNEVIKVISQAQKKNKKHKKHKKHKIVKQATFT